MSENVLRVLLLDSSIGFPSPLLAEALEELADEERYEQHFVDDAPFFGSLGTTLAHRLIRRGVGHPLTVGAFNRHINEVANAFRPDVVIVVKGSYVSIETLKRLRGRGAVLVNYATDDPFSKASGLTPWVREGIPYYDLFCSTKRAIVADVYRAGCSRAEFLPCAYKPSVHFPESASTAEEGKRFASDVLFVGGCDIDRIPYFVSLLQAIPGLRLHLYGGYWDRHPVLRPYALGFVRGREYRLAMAGTKVAVNLVRRMNRDGHVMRSFEIPACGAFMLAERTSEHGEFFEEDREMVCFGSPKELIEKVRTYLPLAEKRREIADAGHDRVVGGNHTYRTRLEELLRAVGPMIESRRRAAGTGEGGYTW